MYHYMYLQPSRAVAVVAFVQSSYPNSFQRIGRESAGREIATSCEADGPSWHQVLATTSTRACRALWLAQPALSGRILARSKW